MRRAAIPAMALLATALVTAPVGAQSVSRLWHRPTTLFWLAPYGGFPFTGGSTGFQQAVGAQLVWPVDTPLRLFTRYESRWAGSGRTDMVSVDAVQRLVGVPLANFGLTAGWAYWHDAFGTVGLRAMWPFFEPTGGHSVVQGWFDVRYAAPLDHITGKGEVWAELMVAFVLPVYGG